MAAGFKILDAYVQVTAETSDVKTASDKMARDVQSASEKIQAARKREADTSGALRLAELRLAELRKTEPADSIRLIAAEERYAAAQRNSAAAIAASARASSQLAASKIRQNADFKTAGSGLGSSLMGGMQGVIGGLVGGVVSAFAAPLVQGVNQAIGTVMTTVKSAVIDYNTALENANIGFTTMLGSATKARSFLGELQKFAASTPFEFSDLTLASQRLMAMGIHAKDVIPTMTAIGDAVAGLGGDKGTIDQITTALGQMTAKGKIQGDEMMQLTEAGIPALKILADAYHVSTGEMSDMITEGSVLSDKAVPAIVRGLEKGTASTKGFGGMMEKQSKTMAGSMSNIQDAINQTLSGAFLPLFKVIEKGAGTLAKFAGSKAVQNWAKDTAKNVGSFLSTIGKAIKQVFGDSDLQDEIKSLGFEIGKSFSLIGPAIKKILPNLISFAKDVLPSVVAAMTVVVHEIPTVLAWWERLSRGLKAIGPFVSAVIDFFSQLSDKLFHISADIGNFVADAISNFRKFGPGIIGALAGLPGKMNQMGQDIFNGLITGITSKYMDVINTVNQMAANVASAFANVLKIQSPSKVFHQYGKWVAEGLQKGLLGSVSDVKSASSALAGAIKDLFTDKVISKSRKNAMLDELKDTTIDLVNQATKRQKVIDKLNDQKSKLSDLKSARSDYRSNIRLSVLDSSNIVNSFQTGADAYSQYQSDLADARKSDAATRMGASAGSLDGRGYQASYSTAAPGTAVAALGPAPLHGLALVKSNLKKMLADTKKFTSNLKTLVKRGMYSELFQQLVSAGPSAGLAITNDLINDKGAFNDINSLGKQLATAGNSLGDYAAGVTYDGQIKSTQRQINRLRNDADNITAVMIIEARKIDEVDKVVKAVKAAAKTAKAKKAAKR